MLATSDASRIGQAAAWTPVMDRTFPLAEAADAIAYQRAGHTRGKSVLVI